MNKPAILLLHGALGSGSQLAHLAEGFAAFADVHVLNFAGHGGDALPQAYSMQDFSEQVRSYLHEKHLKQPMVFGYSMGGYVALYLEILHPGTFSHIVTLATKFEWDPVIAAREVNMLQPELIEKKVPQLAAGLQKRHAPQDWKEVVRLTAGLLKSLGEQPLLNATVLAAITTPVLVLLGDRDKMVGMDETIQAYRHLGKGSLGVLPNTGHPVEQVPVGLLGKLVADFTS